MPAIIPFGANEYLPIDLGDEVVKLAEGTHIKFETKGGTVEIRVSKYDTAVMCTDSGPYEYTTITSTSLHHPYSPDPVMPGWLHRQIMRFLTWLGWVGE